jgi:hypothetical protein
MASFAPEDSSPAATAFDYPLEVSTCARTHLFLAVSPTGLALYGADPGASSVSVKLSHLMRDLSHGYLQKSTWLSPEEVGVLTTFGQVILFKIDGESITPTDVVIPSASNPYVSIASFCGFLLLGDSCGNLVIFDKPCKVVSSLNVSELPIKQISISSSHGILLTADSVPYSFETGRGFPGELIFTQIEGIGSLSAAAQDSNIGAIYDPRGELRIFDFVHRTRLIERVPRLTAMSFSPDGSFLVLFSHQQFGIWKQDSRRLLFYSSENGVSVCSAAVSGRTVLTCSESGLVLETLRVRFGALLVGRSSVFDCISGLTCETARPIDCAAALPGQLVAVASGNDVLLVDWETKTETGASKSFGHQIEKLQWSQTNLCVVHSSSTLEILSVNLEGVKALTFELPILAIGADRGSLVVSTAKQLVVFNDQFDITLIDVALPLLSLKPSSKTGRIYGIDENHDLVCHSATENRLLRHDVTDFFISDDFEILFSIERYDVYAATFSDLDFTLFQTVRGVPVAVESSDLICVNDLELTRLPFGKYALFAHLAGSPKTAAELAVSLSAGDFARLFEISSEILDKKGIPCYLSFVCSLPAELVDEILVETVRSSQTGAEVLREFGTAFDFFRRLAAASLEHYQSQIVRFARDKAGAARPRLAIRFLSVLADESSPSLYMPAALFCLAESHSDIEAIRGCFEILGKLTEKATAVSVEVVSCGGLELDVTVYSELKQQFDDTVMSCVVDLLSGHFSVLLAIELCRMAKIPFADVLRQNQHLAKQWPVPRLVAMLGSDMGDVQALVKEFARMEWEWWVVALHLAAGDRESAARVAAHSEEVKGQLVGTEYEMPEPN